MSSDKNEILFSELNINYNELPEIFKKGSVLLWEQVCDTKLLFFSLVFLFINSCRFS